MAVHWLGQDRSCWLLRRYDFNKGNQSAALQLFNSNFDKSTTNWLITEMKENREKKIAQRKVRPLLVGAYDFYACL